MKYLIFNMSGIGDFFWIYPYCQAIREHDKDSYIVLFSGADSNRKLNERKKSILELLDAVDELEYYNKKEPFHTLGFLIRTKLKRFDYAFCILDYETGMIGNACARITVKMGHISVGLEQKNLKNVEFTITLKRQKGIKSRRFYYSEMLKAIGIEPPIENKKYIDDKRISKYFNSLGFEFKHECTYIGLVIGAGFGAYIEDGVYHYIDIKNWAINKWIELSDRFLTDGIVPILLGGPAEKDKIMSFEDKISSNVINMVGRTSIGESLAIVSKCKLLISCDTGLIHGAYLVGTPILGMFGATDPEIIFPMNIYNKVLFTNEECSPCWNCNEKKKQCKDVKCMNNITVDMVHDRALEILENI